MKSKLTPEIAEICGIHAGDGYIRKSRNEFECSGGFEEKEYYNEWIVPLFNKTFNLNLTARFFYSKGTYGIYSCRKEIINQLLESGFPRGNKSLTVKIPKCILNSNNVIIRRAFLRGIFDTDSCVSFCKKVGNKDPFKITRNYYPRILFTTVSKDLAEGIKILCEKEGFKCTVCTYQPKKENENRKYNLQICGKDAINKWFKNIDPKNSAKRSRFEIWRIHGFCPPSISYEERVKVLKGEVNPDTYYGPVAQPG